jgi:hypothetical protein
LSLRVKSKHMSHDPILQSTNDSSLFSVLKKSNVHRLRTLGWTFSTKEMERGLHVTPDMTEGTDTGSITLRINFESSCYRPRKRWRGQEVPRFC